MRRPPPDEKGVSFLPRSARDSGCTSATAAHVVTSTPPVKMFSRADSARCLPATAGVSTRIEFASVAEALTRNPNKQCRPPAPVFGPTVDIVQVRYRGQIKIPRPPPGCSGCANNSNITTVCCRGHQAVVVCRPKLEVHGVLLDSNFVNTAY